LTVIEARHAMALVVVIAAATLAACSTTATRPDASTGAQPHINDTAATASATGATTAGRAAELKAERDRQQLLEALRQSNVVYFDLDRSDIRDEGRPVIARFGSYLSGHPAARVRLEGHTDERGSREYNVGLGNRRAQAVRLALLAQGARDPQLRTLSYGAERPAADVHDEAAWAKNRRAEIVLEITGEDAATGRK
jgi:peptidoglycan-associated lipoprotein